MKRSSGFTVIELLMVITIIGILMSITVSATTGAIRRAREEQAKACVLAVNQGVAAYYAHEGEWPGQSDSWSDITGDSDSKELTSTEVRSAVKKLVQLAWEGRPDMDISALYVSRHDPGERNEKRVFGMDFMSAIHGTKKGGKKMSLAEMYFGYPESSHGYFHRLRAVYYPKTDRLVFFRQSEADEK